MVFYIFSALFFYTFLILYISGVIYNMNYSIKGADFRAKLPQQLKEAGLPKYTAAYIVSGFLICAMLTIVYFLIAASIFVIAYGA